MRCIHIHDFLNSFSVKQDGSMTLLLGAGTSISSGIKSGGQMVWDFKRTIYCNENRKPISIFSDLSKEDAKEQLQSYFDSKCMCPELYSPDEYSYYFEECYKNRRDRELYIQKQVRDINPALGYLCLGALIAEKRIKIVNTTNFDDLIQAGIYTLCPGLSVKTISSAIKDSIGFNIDEDFPSIIKLHGDYLYDKLKNTSEELKIMENKVGLLFESSLQTTGIIVAGYAGNDNSVMTILENLLKNNKILNGVIWCKPKDSALSERAEKFMNMACNVNECSGVLDIEGFDDLMYRMYLTMNKSFPEIDARWKDSDNKRKIDFRNMKIHNGLVKTNTLPSLNYPLKCYSFISSITCWRELKINHDDSIVAALYKGKVWALGDREKIQKSFMGKITGNLEYNDVPEYMFKLDQSIILGMFYEIIRIGICQKGYICFGKNKYYDSSKYTESKDNKIYDAVEVSLSFIDKKIFLILLPTVYVTRIDGTTLDKLHNQYAVNMAVSSMYNKEVGLKIEEWKKRLLTDGKMKFCIDEAVLEFEATTNNYNIEGQEKKCFQAEEPKVIFTQENELEVSVNQLRGLVNYGPIEKYKNGSVTSSLRLAVLAPKQNAQDIWLHLHKLKKHHVTNSQSEKSFLPEYVGFQEIYRRDIDIPNGNENKRFKGYDLEKVLKVSPQEFYQGICKYIDGFENNRTEFDLLIIYISNSLKMMREQKNETIYFDLHDSLKLYCAEKGIVMQVIEERSVSVTQYTDTAKIMWGLSTGIYAKTVGRLWKPEKYNQNTAYIGLSYVQSIRDGERISIGCSQLFDAEGNGMRLYLRPIKNPQYVQNNPFMRKDDAYKLMMNMKKLYDNSLPTYNLKRVVIHKTTFFTKDEMEGISKGLAGVDDVELLQIQEFTPWRAIRFKENDILTEIASYPIQRGTVILLDDESFLLWTHGSVQDDELAGRNRNYYKNGRGIPAPLLVRRFMGKASGETLVNEIMMLTKMNWNSGDSFYKILPVTLDFAKMLSKIAKQDIVIYDKPYDFRYFM